MHLPSDARARARDHLVATGNPLAARAALDVLDEGGSAIDAAIAADAILGVVEPMATGLGGDLLAMVVEPDGRVVSYNGTGRAPQALTPDRVSALPGARIPERHPLSHTTPGAVRGWADLHARWGRLPWARLLAPAAALAETGYVIAPVAAREWAIFDRVLHDDPDCARLYRAGAPPAAGTRLVNTELAGVLRDIASGGADAFYGGRVAHAAAQASQRAGGLLAEADFAQHTGDFTTPVSTRFRGLQVYECPPNTHGVAILHALQELEPHALLPDDPATMVRMVRAMGAGMAHAKQVVADPAGNTVCTVIVDAEGRAITLMSSIFKRFGSGTAVPGAGFVLQNRGFGFASPGALNGPGPGKRPYHTVVPGAALRNGRFHAGFGVVGGLMQPQGQVQLLVRMAAFGESAQAAVNAPRWRLESDTALAIEAGMPAPIVAALREAGFTDPVGQGELAGRSDFGGAQVVMRLPDGRLCGASDPRKDGMVLGGIEAGTS